MQIFGYFLLEIAPLTLFVLKVLLQKYPFFSIVTGFAMTLSGKQFRHPYGVTLTTIRNNILNFKSYITTKVLEHLI